MKKNLVSIIVNCFNGENYLLKTDESIESLFNEGDMHYSKIGFQLVHDELNYLQSDISKR